MQAEGNAKQVASFKGEAPVQPSYIGLPAASAPGKKSDAWSIADFKVARRSSRPLARLHAHAEPGQKYCSTI